MTREARQSRQSCIKERGADENVRKKKKGSQPPSPHLKERPTPRPAKKTLFSKGIKTEKEASSRRNRGQENIMGAQLTGGGGVRYLWEKKKTSHQPSR